MRVVVITGSDRHHKNLCVRLAAAHDVVGIIHPAGTGGGRLARLRTRARNYGPLYAALTAAPAAPGWLCGWRTEAELDAEAERRFPDAERAYDRLPPATIHPDVDVATTGPGLLGRLSPDVVVVLGGPVYPRELIEAAPLVLNFHSGISPIYNGAATIHFAFANEQPHLCGGTLMTMSPVVDGGEVLAHHLPAIEAHDTPASLFMKTVDGAARLYERILAHLADDRPFASVPQRAPLFYYRSVHWSVYQTLLIRRHVRRDIAARHVRSEEMVEYWREPDGAAARRSHDETIDRLLWGAQR